VVGGRIPVVVKDVLPVSILEQRTSTGGRPQANKPVTDHLVNGIESLSVPRFIQKLFSK
jgi:hypothetical protein